MRLRRHDLTSSRGLLDPPNHERKIQVRSPELAAGEPGMFLPESLQFGIAAAENVALGSTQISHARRERRARSQTASTVAGVLPELPLTPGRGVARFEVIICDPEPAICHRAPLARGHARCVEHLP